MKLLQFTMAKNLKRGLADDGNANATAKVKKLTHWNQGLVAAMGDPDLLVQEDDSVVVIKEKYPKAKHHYLIMPKEHIDGLFKLNSQHVLLLRHMQDVAIAMCERLNISFKIGYHSIPSMTRLHLHVISDDMVSPSLKNKKHWNSFTTTFFIPSEDIIKMVEKNGAVSKISDKTHKELMSTPLKCHKCSFAPKNIPQLKEHILLHLK